MEKVQIVAVFHYDKVEPPPDTPAIIAVNTPLTYEEYCRVHDELIEKLEPHGPFNEILCSRLCRTVQMASVFALHYNMEFRTIKHLGQHISRGGDSTIHRYPGYDNEWFPSWHENGFATLRSIAEKHDDGDKVLIFTHRPIITVLFCHCKGVLDYKIMEKVNSDPDFAAMEFVIFEVGENGVMTIVRGDYEIPKEFMESC